MKKQNSQLGLAALFSLIVLIILVITTLIVMIVSFALDSLGLKFPEHVGPRLPMIVIMLASIAVGTVVSVFMSRVALKPIRKVIAAMNRLASGDFSARLDIKKPPELADLAESFNLMAQELSNTELLRTDFINNFSHEFKTPIVSVKGFAEMLKYDDLTKEERDEYLDIVISESSRLASLASNVLNMSKIEKLEILPQKELLNVGEQIRKCVILLQQKWEQKKLDVTIDGEDCFIEGNEELLSQLWLNLIENAIKFSPECGTVSLSISGGPEFVFRIHNSGKPISDEGLRHVFDKFYQDDNSRTSAGNGLGLSICKRIAELHGGGISAESGESGTTFTVNIPLK